MTQISTEESINILGLMTGSSADGLDACLVNFSGASRSPRYEVIESYELSYPSHFQSYFKDPLRLKSKEIESLDLELGKWFASAISELDIEFDVIASHGQTIKHEPPHFTLQIGHPGYMADQFKVPVIYDFRSRDIQHGGQGAPLIPIVDEYLFKQTTEDVLALNIGGIANLTVIPGHSNPAPVRAWDTGPGNTLIDRAVRRYTQGKLNYDRDGNIAAQGHLNRQLLGTGLSHEFYQQLPPRSAGQEQFGEAYFEGLLNLYPARSEKDFKDLIYTLTVLTSKTIASSIKTLGKTYSPRYLKVAGGGGLNKTLMNELSKDCPSLSISLVDHAGVNHCNKEAFGFAYLAYLFLHDLPGNLPSVTGASRPVVLGKRCDPNRC